MTRYHRTRRAVASLSLIVAVFSPGHAQTPPPGPDTTPPAVANFTVGATTPTSVAFQITFSETVAGGDATDFTAVTTGGATATIGAVTGTGAAYTVPVSFTGTGTVQLNLKATGTAIVDAANLPLTTGASSPVFTITGGGTTSGAQVTSVTPPPNGTYGKNDVLTFALRFSGNVTVTTPAAGVNPAGKATDEDDDDDGSPYFTWNAAPAAAAVRGGPRKVQYQSGSGTDTLTFRLKVHNGDVAPAGIQLGNTIILDGAQLRDASGGALAAQNLTLPWTQNPLTGVILDAAKPGNGNSGNANAGNNGNGKGKGRMDRLVNLSSRLRVTGGDASRSVVAGFVVLGETPKEILIRAIGPGLAGFGVRDALGQPTLVLRDSTGKVVAENDGWKNQPEISSAGDKIGAFKLPNGSRDAALLVTLSPGSYTAQVTANGNGLTLLEVYDTVAGEDLATEQIVNISTRGFVGIGDDAIVAGFVVTGSTPKRVLIRGIGPALTGFGVPGALGDPVLRLFRAGTTDPIAQNDNWETPQGIGSQAAATAAEITAAATAAGAFPFATGSKDAAIVVTLAAGNYSAILSGANNTTGAGMIEVYELP